MNNEPVAWMQHYYETEKVTKFSLVKVWEDDIPLYTHPAKTLTDEDVKYNVTVKWDDKTTHHKNVSDGTPLHYNEPKTLTDEEIAEVINEHGWRGLTGYLLTFAHAILRKAQEK